MMEYKVFWKICTGLSFRINKDDCTEPMSYIVSYFVNLSMLCKRIDVIKITEDVIYNENRRNTV